MDYMEFKNQMLAEIEERLTEKEYACYEPADGNMLEESLVRHIRKSRGWKRSECLMIMSV